MRAALVMASFPRWALRFFDYMYTDCRSMLLVAGEVVTDARVLCDVRQECPASGCLFAIAINPIVRAIASGPGPRAQVPFLPLRTTYSSAPLLETTLSDDNALEKWAEASGLQRQTAKCEVVPLAEGPLHGCVRTYFVDIGDRAADVRVTIAGRCLGIVLGLEAATHTVDYGRCMDLAAHSRCADDGVGGGG